MSTNILFIIGSMREKSFNKELAETTKELIGNRAKVTFLNYKDIPFMNQDLEANLPEVVKDIKKEVQDSESIWIFTPEYNGMVPGVLKNLLDWLSRSYIPGDFSSGTPIKGKPVTFSGVGGSNKTASSREQLGKLLKRIGMKVMDEPSCGFAVTPVQMKSNDWTITEEDKQEIEKQISAFLEFIEKNK